MARTVREVMNRELFTLRPDEGIDEALRFLAALGISGAPVVEEGRPIGVVSFRDLLADRRGDTVRDRMSTPVLTIEGDARIEAAARAIAERGVHRIVVVDPGGRAIGVASSLDLLRGMLGIPAAHPATFPHLDLTTGLTWSDDAAFDLEHAEVAPQSPGLLVLVHGAAGVPERVVWAESCDDLRARLLELLAYVPDEPSTLKQLLAHPHEIRFRAATATNARERRRALQRILADAHRERRSLAP